MNEEDTKAVIQELRAIRREISNLNINNNEVRSRMIDIDRGFATRVAQGFVLGSV